MSNHSVFLKQMIYSLKHRYGVYIDFYQFVSSDFNIETGRKTVIKKLTKIRKAIPIDAKLLRDFDYDLSFIAANKNFTYGGFFDKNIRSFIISKKDLPKNYEENIEDYIVHDMKRYNIKEVKQEDYFCVFTCEQIQGQVPSQIIDESIIENLSITQLASGVL